MTERPVSTRISLALVCGVLVSCGSQENANEGALSQRALQEAGSIDDPGPEDLGGAELLGGLGQLLEIVGAATESQQPWPLPAQPRAWSPDASDRVPLVAGLTVTTAIEDPAADYESVKRVLDIDSEIVKISYESVGHDLESGRGDLRVTRTIHRTDLRTSHAYRMSYGATDAPSYPGWTAIGVSASVLAELKSKGRTGLEVVSPGDPLGAFIAAGAEIDPLPLIGEVEHQPESVAFPVIWNGERVWLPALHVVGALRGAVSDVPVEFLFLDDPENPLTLRAAVGATRLQLIRIDVPDADVESSLEQALEESGRVELSGIYFASASAEILPASKAVLDQVAALLSKHEDWTMEVGGHTDAIGSNDSNTQLSVLRAEAVVDALAARMGEDVRDRLRPQGYGESQPIEPNETLEGRARNRRVELARIDR